MVDVDAERGHGDSRWGEGKNQTGKNNKKKGRPRGAGPALWFSDEAD
jgi:hypothetical protein